MYANCFKALLAIFRRRTSDREKEASIEQCSFQLQAHQDETECRLVFQLSCKSNVVKVYKLTYESAEVLSATFDKQNSPNRWSIASKTLKDAVDFFGPKTEHVDWSLIDGKVIFTSYTEKIQVGKEIVRQPTHTSITFNEKDFQECKIEAAQHISIPVKDFRAIVAHADSMKVNVKASYSHGHRPIRIEYGSGGLLGEFTLMTKGTSSSVAENLRRPTPARNPLVRAVSQRATPRRDASALDPTQSDRAPTPAENDARDEQDERPAPVRVRPPRAEAPSAPPTQADPNSFFIPADAEQDQQWDPQNFEDDDHGLVTWDNTGVSAFDPLAIASRRLRNNDGELDTSGGVDVHNNQGYEIAPTQRLSQIKGIFD